MAFRRAQKAGSKLRMALIGPSGSGKTMTSLILATGLAERGIAVIDTERGSSEKYADRFQFDVLDLEQHSPDHYRQAIDLAIGTGVDVLVIDSLSHAWMGRGGALEQVDRLAERSGSGNSFAAWRSVTPMHNRLVDALVACPMHVIVTMRTKTEWVLEENEKGKKQPRKIGLAPVQRDGLEYEFDVVADMQEANRLVISKTRCPELTDLVIEKPGADLALTLRRWLAGVETPLGRLLAMAMAATSVAELEEVFRQAEKLSESDKGRLRPVCAARLARLRGVAAPASVAQVPGRGPRALVQTSAGEPQIEHQDTSLLPTSLFAIRTTEDLPQPIAGAWLFVAEPTPRWHYADVEAKVWRTVAKDHTRKRMRAELEAAFAARGWSDMGPAGAVDLIAGGHRLMAETAAATTIEEPLQGDGEDQLADTAVASPVAPAPFLGDVRDGEVHRKVWIQQANWESPQDEPAAGDVHSGDLVLRALPNAEPIVLERDGSTWVPKPRTKALLMLARKALYQDVIARAIVCRLQGTALTEFAKTKVQERRFATCDELSVRSLVVLRTALAELAAQPRESTK